MTFDTKPTIDSQRVNLTPPNQNDIEKAIKACAMVAGQTKSEIESTIREQWLYGHPERIKEALKFLWTLFDGRERMNRKVIRAGRLENKMTFSQILKKKLNGKTK